jgi:Family of unknown function (DUF6600)/FecR protein
MNRIKLWPHGVLIILGVAAVAGIAAALWFKYERSAQANGLPNAARIERVDGQVGVNRSLDSETNSQWIEARANTPVSVGDRIYTKENSRIDIAFTGRNAATVDANTSLDILDLSRDKTQVALRTGSALFDVGSITSGQLFEVATPCGAVDLNEPGIYQVSIDPNGNATATAFSGSAQVVGQQGSGTIRKGEVLSVPCQEGSSATVSRVNYDQAGTYLDNHFRSRYPRKYDGRYRSYYTYLDDPYYYDPAQSYTSYNYVSDYVPGVYDLDDYGDWSYVNDYGYAWHPRVDAGWAPYQAGYWETDYPYGLTWVSNEPWGYAPYHYGRWAYASNEWFWVPDSTTIYPTYSPALTAFIPLGDSSVGWVALGPGDPYVNRYYDPYWQPVYLTTPTVTERFANINVPGAVAVVPAQSFGQVINQRDIIRVDPQVVARSRPVLDPLTVSEFRQIALNTRRPERRFDMSQAVARRLDSTPVVVANTPSARPFRRDLVSAMRAEPLPARARRQEMKLRDERAATAQQPQPQAPNLAAEQARERQIADLARQAARGDRGARQQMQELRRQQGQQARVEDPTRQAARGGQGVQKQMQELRRQQMQQARVEGVASQRAQGERVGQPMPPAQNQRQIIRQQRQAQREAERQQMINNQQLRRAEPPRIQNQRESKPPQTQRAQPPVIRHAPNSPPLRPQPQPRSEPQPQAQPRRKPEVQVQRQQSQPRVMSAPRPQPVPQVQPRPQMERRGPPAQSQAQPRAQQQPRAQPQAQPRAQPQAQPQQQPAKGHGKPAKKP